MWGQESEDGLKNVQICITRFYTAEDPPYAASLIMLSFHIIHSYIQNIQSIKKRLYKWNVGSIKNHLISKGSNF